MIHRRCVNPQPTLPVQPSRRRDAEIRTHSLDRLYDRCLLQAFQKHARRSRHQHQVIHLQWPASSTAVGRTTSGGGGLKSVSPLTSLRLRRDAEEASDCDIKLPVESYEVCAEGGEASIREIWILHQLLLLPELQSLPSVSAQAAASCGDSSSRHRRARHNSSWASTSTVSVPLHPRPAACLVTGLFCPSADFVQTILPTPPLCRVRSRHASLARNSLACTIF